MSRYNVLLGGRKKYTVTIVRFIRTENFPLREIRTWEKVRYNGGYVVNGVRCNAIPLYFVPSVPPTPAQYPSVYTEVQQTSDIKDT